MSYIKDRIAKNLKGDEAYRDAYDEEVRLLAEATERRQQMIKRLVAIRKTRHLTQEQLAKKLRISQERVSQIERGTETLSVDRLLDMANALGARMVLVDEADISTYGLEKMIIL